MKNVHALVPPAAALLLAVSSAFAQTPADSAPAVGILTLKNGDRFSATIESLDPDTGILTIRHPFASRPIEIPFSALVQYRVARPSEPTAPPESWQVETVGEERWIGAIERMDSERLHLTHPTIGSVAIARADLETLNQHAVEALIYEGPAPNEEWRLGRETIKAAADSIEGKQGVWVGRELPPLPRRVRIEATVQAGFPTFLISFFGESVQKVMENRTDSYQLNYQMGVNLSLLRFTLDQGARQIGSVNLNQRVVHSRPVTLTLIGDMDRRRIVIFANNRQVAEWIDERPFKNLGSTLAFISYQSAFVVSKIRVTEWDGRLPGDTRAKSAENNDVLELQNGDNVSGAVLSIHPPSITVQSPFGNLDIPLKEVSRVEFKTTGMKRAATDQLRLKTRDGSLLLVRPHKISERMLHGESLGGGAVKIPLSAIREILGSDAAGKTAEKE